VHYRRNADVECRPVAVGERFMNRWAVRVKNRNVCLSELLLPLRANQAWLRPVNE
jgi:hypothetical protein